MSPLFTLHNIQSASGTFTMEVRFDATHEVFAGHFPGKPVVPGVFLVEILAAAVAEINGKHAIVKEASNIKFLQVIDPTLHPSVILEGTIMEEDDGNFKVDALFRQGELLFARMKGMKFTVRSYWEMGKSRN